MWHLCRRFEVPTPLAANSVRNFKSKSGTRIIELLVPLCFRSSCQRVLQCITNFGSGALASYRPCGNPTPAENGRQGTDDRGVACHMSPSAADLKFLHHLRQARLGTSNRKAALES